MSIILLNLLVGPPMFRLALLRVGEAKAGGKALPVGGKAQPAHSHGGGPRDGIMIAAALVDEEALAIDKSDRQE